MKDRYILAKASDATQLVGALSDGRPSSGYQYYITSFKYAMRFTAQSAIDFIAKHGPHVVIDCKTHDEISRVLDKMGA